MCTEEEVYDLIAELVDSKSSGPDGKSVKMLKAPVRFLVSRRDPPISAAQVSEIGGSGHELLGLLPLLLA